jgi:2-polyprenyl-3-methyl-5-hydroxy-6-metoxy-1,4-benzoquinol methylase
MINTWHSPRASIASRYKDNDFGYAIHGAKVVAEILTRINEQPSVLKSKTILDYGAGTGRIAKILSFHFKNVLAYDPTPECQIEDKKEIELINSNCSRILKNNYKLVGSIFDIFRDTFDYAVCVNVFEHLDLATKMEALSDIMRSLKVGGTAILYLSVPKNCAAIIKELSLDTDDEYKQFINILRIKKIKEAQYLAKIIKR